MQRTFKAFISIKYHADNRNREQIENISGVLEACGFETICIARDVERWGQVQLGPKALMARTFDEIATSDLVVVDLTEKGVGLGIEAGYAHAHAVPVVTIARKGSDISETLRGISRQVFEYEAFDDLKHLVTQLRR